MYRLKIIGIYIFIVHIYNSLTYLYFIFTCVVLNRSIIISASNDWCILSMPNINVHIV